MTGARESATKTVGQKTRKRDRAGRWQATWTRHDDYTLRRLRRRGAERAAQELGRSVAAVRKRAARLGISLRPAGERRGIILGVPRGVGGPAIAAYRRDVLEGRADAESVLKLVRGFAAVERGEVGLCPRCAIRPQHGAGRGFCRVCELYWLAERHDAAGPIQDLREPPTAPNGHR